MEIFWILSGASLLVFSILAGIALIMYATTR
jgi:hypothetical protein